MLNFAAVIVSIMTIAAGDVENSSDAQLRRSAKQLSKELLIIDTHEDVPYLLQNKHHNISVENDIGDFDYPRARRGGLDAVFMAVYVSPNYAENNDAKAFTDETINIIEKIAADNCDKFTLARSVNDVRSQFGDEKVSIVLCIENGSALEGDLDNIKHFYNRGVRYITLVHSKANEICDSSFGVERKWKGLSPFGEKVIAEMNRLGMMIDISHVSDEAFYQIMKLSRAPVVATHSSCRHFTPGWERNVDDKMIKLLASKGGVIQINFGTMFLSEEVNKQYSEGYGHIDEYARKNNLTKLQRSLYTKKYFKENPITKVPVSKVADHIDHVVNLVGIDYVGLGSDFDGVGDELPEGLEDVSGFPNLLYELLKRGYSRSDIEKICSGNFLRVWSEIEVSVGKLPPGS